MNRECHIVYDGTFEGFLCVIFDIYDRRLNPHTILVGEQTGALFEQLYHVETDPDKAIRVAKGIVKRSRKKSTFHFIYACFLSEQEGIEKQLLYLIQHIFSNAAHKITDYTDPVIVELQQIHKKIGREVHRMHAFVRFQETKDNIWACAIEPDFNVLPLIGKHFKDRYPAQQWLIYDTQRHYGIHYKIGEEIVFVTFDTMAQRGITLGQNAITADEIDYQNMWRQYFQSVNIPERNNPRLHQRHVPRRYWKYLIEKQ